MLGYGYAWEALMDRVGELGTEGNDQAPNVASATTRMHAMRERLARQLADVHERTEAIHGPGMHATRSNGVPADQGPNTIPREATETEAMPRCEFAAQLPGGPRLRDTRDVRRLELAGRADLDRLDLVEARRKWAESKLTLDQAEVFLEQVGSPLLLALQRAGYTVHRDAQKPEKALPVKTWRTAFAVSMYSLTEVSRALKQEAGRDVLRSVIIDLLTQTGGHWTGRFSSLICSLNYRHRLQTW
jgi:hypothetical protein